MGKRIWKLTIVLTLILGLGLGYAFLWKWTGFSIPCMFYQITGFYCPGCGVSRMCIKLLELNIKEAFGHNPMVFCLLPFLAIYCVRQSIWYIKGVKWQVSRWESILWKILVAVMLIFGIVRNLPGVTFLGP